MTRYFVPYSGRKPAATLINGHRLLILSRDKDSFEDHLDSLGADRVKAVSGGMSEEEDEVILSRLASGVKANLVIAPRDVGVCDVIRNLEEQLPWIQ